MKEVWKPIVGISNYYVSSFGNIRHVNSNKNRILCKDKLVIRN